MLDIYEEFLQLVKKFHAEGISYALCGGLALAIYDVIRATVDIDLLVLTQSLEHALKAATDLGYEIKANPMSFAGGKIQIHKVSKIDTDIGQPLSIDFLLVTDDLEWVWKDRKKISIEQGPIWVVSQAGLIYLKQLRGNAQDKEDIEELRGSNESD